jgi:hypothetical protein
MRARWTLNLLLLMLVAGLGWAVLRDLREAEETSPLTGMDPARIEGVELTRPGRDTVKLERITGGAWRMTAPYRIAADPERVARLLGVVQASVLRSFPASGANLEPLGLEPEPVRVSLGGQTLRFGGTEPIDGLRYVASGDLVLLIKDLYYHLLTAPASDYVDLHPLPVGLAPASGDLNGEALDPTTLTAISAIKAERVEPLDGDLTGRILRIQPQGDGATLRFLVSPDGLRWSRPDLRLTYLVGSPPPVLVEQEAAGAAVSAAQTERVPQAPAAGMLSEQAVGVVEGLGPPPGEGQAAPAPESDRLGGAEAEADVTAAALSQSGGEGPGEPVVDPGTPMEIRVERLAPDDPSSSVPESELDPVEARQRQIEDAVSASFGGPPLRSQAQLQREEAGVDEGDAIVSPEEAAGPPPAVKLRP